LRQEEKNEKKKKE